jgi:hypothetical protein
MWSVTGPIRRPTMAGRVFDMLTSGLSLAVAAAFGHGSASAKAAEPTPHNEVVQGSSTTSSADADQYDGKRHRTRPTSDARTLRPQRDVASPGVDPQSDSITVLGTRSREMVRGNVRPLRVFDPIDIRAFGASSVQDLLGTLQNDTSGNSGDPSPEPIVLVNGRRVSSINEVAKYPTEAIERVEVYPEEVATKYGFAANQRVVNLVLFKRFTQRSVQGNVKVLTEGGGLSTGLSTQLLSIHNGIRFNANVQAMESAAIYERQRKLGQEDGAGDASSPRALVPKLTDRSIRLGMGGVNLGSIGVSVTAGATISETRAALGSLEQSDVYQRTSNRIFDLGGTLDGEIGSWQWASTTSFQATDLKASIEQNGRSDPLDRTRSTLRLLTTDLTLAGNLIRVPAGALSATFRVAQKAEHIASPVGDKPTGAPASASRATTLVIGELSLPISRRITTSLLKLGDLTASAQAGFEKVEGRGRLDRHRLSLSWSPSRSLSILMSQASEQAAPTLLQLASPLIEVPNARVFDFSRLEDAVVTQVFGGNSALTNERRRTFDTRITLRPPSRSGLYAVLSYSELRVGNRIVNFPFPTLALQSAFPQRFVVNDQKRIQAIDARPLNIFASSTKKLGLNLSWSSPMAKSSPNSEIGVNPNPGGPLPSDLVPPDAKVVYAPPGTPLPPDVINALSRIFVSLNYTYLISDKVRLTEEAPQVNLLNGFALSRLGGSSRHDLRLSAGLFRRGLGFRGELAVKSGSTIDYASLGGPTAKLRYSYNPTLNVQIFLNPQDRIVGTVPSLLKDLQVTLRIDNALNVKTRVVDADGRTPYVLRPDFLDPTGRSITFTARKIF